MRHFHLERHQDVSGVSGTGRVADGVVFSDGVSKTWVILHWLREPQSISIHFDLSSVATIHGHGGHTEIVMDDEGDA